MAPQELKKLRTALAQEIEVLEVELRHIATENPSIKGDYLAQFHKAEPGDTLDEQARSVTDYEEDRAVEQSLELRLREAKETLKKIDEGTFGVCEKCASPIDAKRLKAVPVAKLCVACTKKTGLV
jgi:DnaK suppressor protein